MTDPEANDGTGPALALGIALLLGVFASLVAAPGAEGMFGAFLAALMLAIAAHDARHYLIPNVLTGAAFALALLRAATFVPDVGAEALLWPVIRAAAVAIPLLLLMAFYRRWRGRDGLGLGDVKLAAVCGAWLDLATVVVVIELAALLAIGAYAAHAALQRKPLRTTAYLPFGLFLAPAIWIGWLGETWYAGWLGGWPG
ncbi:prepilin signal peptidase PulO-like peptidase [Bradyrhizobium sp. YR681]|uniref:prepilin peptidase n=1 Tax=Bradyrhizobium sp. YR681 TaxID=1144344 RepID=UPI00027139C5|nr:A24 family peptidase [Bradyrhizobium sp. YR681]EJN12857.1 prepilin signal peptidase PulO-like peptidase [Bradyrhizobium sp. YR681]